MACGDRYKHLAVTKSGYDPDNPNGAFYLPSDYSEWTAVADRVVELVNKHILELQQIEAEHGKGFKYFGPLSGERATLLRAREDLPSLLLAAGKDLPKVIDVVMQGLCLLEQVDDAIADYGVTPPELPSPGRDPKPPPLPGPSSIGNAVITLAIVGAVVGVGYFFFKSSGSED